MSKIKINIYIDSEFYKEDDIFISLKIGQFIKSIVDNMEDRETIDILGTKLFYDDVILDHFKTFENYIDFQYKKTDIYKLSLIPKFIHKRRISTSSDISTSLPSDLNLMRNKHNNETHLIKNQTDRIFNIETKLSVVETKLSVVETKLSVVETKLSNIESKISNIETKLDEILLLLKNNT